MNKYANIILFLSWYVNLKKGFLSISTMDIWGGSTIFGSISASTH